MAAATAAVALAGCGGALSGANVSADGASANGSFSISPGTAAIDTNCTGCNAAAGSGAAAEQFKATLARGSVASVTWTVSGGDAAAGPGTISSSGVYTPPSYLTADSVKVTVTAALKSAPGGSVSTASAVLTITPGFLQPLTPENVAVGSGSTVIISGYIAEAGGSAAIDYALSSTATGLSGGQGSAGLGSTGGQGSLGTTSCVRGTQAFTYCTVTYSAPATVSSTAATYVVATLAASSSTEAAEILLNSEGVDSNPATHQTQQSSAIALGTSGGNNNDYDENSQSQIVDCCSGTLGALLQASNGTQYLLSNNHVLARSDQASVGDTIVQPGLIDDNCSPFGDGGTERPVGTLTGWVPLNSTSTNVDAAIAQVDSGAVNSSGAILELGTRQSNGLLAAAPPGISSSGGKGEAASIDLTVAKSGRTTGLTCGSVSTVALDVQVSYYTDCAETDPYYTKTYTDQIGIEGNQFSDAGDSGSLVVDTANAEPVSLYFAGGINTGGVSEGVANPVSDVLNELSSQAGNGTTYRFVGGADHAVSCLNYGSGTAAAAQARTLSGAEMDRDEQAMVQARALVNSSTGVLGIATGKSSDHAGEGTVIVYVDPAMNPSVPAMIDGVRTEVIPATAQSVAFGTAPSSALVGGALPALPAAVVSHAISIKQQITRALMKQNPAFFGVGVGQSLDDPSQAALVIYIDRNQVPAQLPATVGGLRTRYIIMERLHVTRSYAEGVPSHSRCMSHPAPRQTSLDLLHWSKPLDLNLY